MATSLLMKSSPLQARLPGRPANWAFFSCLPGPFREACVPGMEPPVGLAGWLAAAVCVQLPHWGPRTVQQPGPGSLPVFLWRWAIGRRVLASRGGSEFQEASSAGPPRGHLLPDALHLTAGEQLATCHSTPSRHSAQPPAHPPTWHPAGPFPGPCHFWKSTRPLET